MYMQTVSKAQYTHRFPNKFESMDKYLECFFCTWLIVFVWVN